MAHVPSHELIPYQSKAKCSRGHRKAFDLKVKVFRHFEKAS